MKQKTTENTQQKDSSSIQREQNKLPENSFALSPPSYGIGLADSPSDIFIQPKLNTVSLSTENYYEREADQMSELAIKRISEKTDNEVISSPPNSTENKFAKNISSLSKNKNSGMFVNPELASKINTKKGMGTPLPIGIKSEMEAAFGTNFGNVRIHNDSDAAKMNQAINAKAFTNGNDIFFNQGQFGYSSPEGHRLLGHELTHVIQQSSSNINTIQRQVAAGTPLSSTEVVDSEIGNNNADTKTPPQAPEIELNSHKGKKSKLKLGNVTQTVKPKQAPVEPIKKETLESPPIEKIPTTPSSPLEGLKAEKEKEPNSFNKENQSEKPAPVKVEHQSTKQEEELEYGDFGYSNETPLYLADTEVIDRIPTENNLGEFDSASHLVEAIDPVLYYALLDEYKNSKKDSPIQVLPPSISESILAARKEETQASFNNFLTTSQQFISELDTLGQTIAPNISNAVLAATNSVSEKMEMSKSTIKEKSKTAKIEIRGKSKRLRKKIISRFSDLNKTILDGTNDARNKINESYDNENKYLGILEKDMLDHIVTSMDQGYKDCIQIGNKVGGEAWEYAMDRAKLYDKREIPTPSWAQGENYYINRHHARVDAAKQTGSGYFDEFRKLGKEAGDNLIKGKFHLIKSARKQIRKAKIELKDRKDFSLSNINSIEKDALNFSENQIQNLLEGLDQTVSSQIRKINRIRKSQLKTIDTMGQSALNNINIAEKLLTKYLKTQFTILRNRFAEKVNSDAKSLSVLYKPDPQIFDSIIQEFLNIYTEEKEKIQIGIQTNLISISKTIATQNEKAISVLQQNEINSSEQITTWTQQSNSILNQINQSASRFVKHIKKETTKQIKNTTENGKNSLYDFTTYIDKNLGKSKTALDDRLYENKIDLEKDFRKGSYSIGEKITENAEKAAEAVKPGWATVLKIIIDVLITIIVTVAIILLAGSGIGLPLLIGLSFVIGAAGGVAKQYVQDRYDNKTSSTKDYVFAGLKGGVNGVVTLVGARASIAVGEKFAAQGASLLFRQKAAGFGAEVVVGTVIDTAGGTLLDIGEEYYKKGEVKWEFIRDRFKNNAAMSFAGNFGGGLLGKGLGKAFGKSGKEVTEGVIEQTSKETAQQSTKEISEEIIDQTTKQIAEETTQQTTKEIVEETLEQTTKQVSNETTQQTTKEIAEKTVEQTTKQVSEGTTQQASKEIAEKTVEQTTKQVSNETTQKTSKKIAEETVEQTTEQVSKETTQQASTKSIRSPQQKSRELFLKESVEHNGATFKPNEAGILVRESVEDSGSAFKPTDGGVLRRESTKIGNETFKSTDGGILIKESIENNGTILKPRRGGSILQPESTKLGSETFKKSNGVLVRESIEEGGEKLIPAREGILIKQAIEEGGEKFTRDISSLAQQKELYHAKSSMRIAGFVYEGIDPKQFGANNRFGPAFYLAERGKTAIDEIGHHLGKDGKSMKEVVEDAGVIRYEVDTSQLKILDLTDEALAKQWKMDEAFQFEKLMEESGPLFERVKYRKFQEIAKKAKAAGYSAVKFKSQRGIGDNLAILEQSAEFYKKFFKPQKPVPAIKYSE